MAATPTFTKITKNTKGFVVFVIFVAFVPLPSARFALAGRVTGAAPAA